MEAARAGHRVVEGDGPVEAGQLVGRFPDPTGQSLALVASDSAVRQAGDARGGGTGAPGVRTAGPARRRWSERKQGGGGMSALTAARWDVRHAFRLQRFELVGFAALIALLAAAGVGVAGLLDATGYGAACDPMGGGPPACAAMGRSYYDLQSRLVPVVQDLLLTVPYLLGLVAGPPLVARELERGTGRLAWSLAPSRVRWFIARVLPILVAVFVLALVAGLALDRLMASMEPGTDVFESFAGFGGRGVVFAARVVFVFAIGVAGGAVLGRTLPALLVTAVIAAIAISGGSYVHSRWLASEAVFVDDAAGTGTPGSLIFDQRLRDATGRTLTWDEAYALVPPEQFDEQTGLPEGWIYQTLLVPGERYPFVQAREATALAGASFIALAIAAIAVTRRRPG